MVEGDRLILTIDRLCNRAHVLTVAALDGDAVRIIESRTGRSTTDAVGRFVAPTPLHGPETVVIHFDGADPARVANANIRISVAPLAA